MNKLYLRARYNHGVIANHGLDTPSKSIRATRPPNVNRKRIYAYTRDK